MSSNSPTYSCNLDPTNQAHENLVLNHFGIIRGRGPTFRPDPYANYGPRFYTQKHFETYEMYADLRKLRDEIPYDLVRPQVHYPDTYARSLKDVLIIILAHYPLHSDRRRPMEVNSSGDFIEPSLRAIADVWIAVLARNGVHPDSAKCMIYSSILVFDVLPISGNSKFGGKDGKNPHSEIYIKIFKASQTLVKAIFDRLVGECPNALGVFPVGKAAFEACPALIEGLSIKRLNERVCHPCLIFCGKCRVVSADAWIDQSLKVLKLVTGAELSINDDERNNVCYVTPSNRARHAKIAAEEAADEAKKAAAAEAKRIKDEDKAKKRRVAAEKNATKAAEKAAAAEAKKAAAAETKRIKDENNPKKRSVASEEMSAWRKRIRLAPNNDLSFSVNDLSTITTPRSASPAKKTPVRIKLSLRSL